LRILEHKRFSEISIKEFARKVLISVTDGGIYPENGILISPVSGYKKGFKKVYSVFNDKNKKRS
jgi:hypothetical protein